MVAPRSSQEVSVSVALRPSGQRAVTRWRFAVSIASVSGLLLAAGCGAGSEVGGSQTKIACDITQPANQTTVNILAYNSAATDPFTNALTANCKSDKLTINHPATDLSGQKQRAVQSLSGSTASYDLIEEFGTVYPLYADRGWTVPLDDFINKNTDKYSISSIDPQLLSALKYNGHQFGLPTYWSVQHLVYRKDIFDKLSLKPPTTFNELRTVAKKIQDSGDVKFPLAVPMAPANDIQGLFGQALRSLGGDYFVPGQPVPALNGPTAVKAVEAVQSLLPFMSPQVLSFSSPEVTTQLQTGQAAMGLLVTGRLGPLVDPTKSPNAKDFAFATPPSIAAGGQPLSFLSVDGFGVAKNSTVDPKLLSQLAAVATGPEAAKAALPNALPARLDLLKGTNVPFAASAQDILKSASPKPLDQVPYMADVYSVIGAPIGDAVSGKKPVQAALDEAQAAAISAIAKAGYAK